jgi:anti-sigma factor RsiW
MTCAYSRETLALLVENDLPASQSDRVRRHVAECEKCRKYCEGLQASQSAIQTRLKPSFQAALTPELLTTVRQTVLSQIDDAPRTFGWAWRMERALVLSFRRHAYAFAGLTILLVLSASVLAQIQHPVTMARPDGYRSWILVGSTLSEGSVHNVYISPAAYREFAKTRAFPEGTVMVLEGMRTG